MGGAWIDAQLTAIVGCWEEVNTHELRTETDGSKLENQGRVVGGRASFLCVSRLVGLQKEGKDADAEV